MPDMHFIVDKTFKDLMARGHDATCFLKFLYNKGLHEEHGATCFLSCY